MRSENSTRGRGPNSHRQSDLEAHQTAGITLTMEAGLHHSIEGTTRPLSALCKQQSKTFGSNSAGPGSLHVHGLKSNTPGSSFFCTGRLCIFFVLGSLVFIMGVVIGGLYFNIRDLTTSLEYTEVLPTYVPAVAMIITGFAVFVLFWNRVKTLVVVTVVTCTTTALLDVVAAILTGTHVIQVIQSLLQCRYYSGDRQCKCSSPYSRTRLQLEYSVKEPEMYVFKDVDNCESVQDSLLQLIYGLCAAYTAGVFLCAGSAIMASLVYWMEQSRQKLHQDAYEEVYTVSGGSSIASESDNEQVQQVEPVVLQPRRISTERSSQNPSRRTSAERSMPSLPQRISTERSAVNLPKRTSTEKPSVPMMGLRRSQSFIQSHETAVSLEESTDNLLTDTSLESSSATLQNRHKRRRHRRAMTLHNLDSKQLLLILNLQMRYMQESRSLQNSRSQTPVPVMGGRHTPTPNPLNTKVQAQTPQQPQPTSDRNLCSIPTSIVMEQSVCEARMGSNQMTRNNNIAYMSNPQSETGLPNTRIGRDIGTAENVQDNHIDPRYVSLPKLPRRSPTPQAIYMNPGRPKSTSPRILNSLSDPSISQLHHHLHPHHHLAGPESSTSKMDMLNQRLARNTMPINSNNAQPPDYVNVQRMRHHSQPAQPPPSRSNSLLSRSQVQPHRLQDQSSRSNGQQPRSHSHVFSVHHPAHGKYPENHYSQVSAYARSRTPSEQSSQRPSLQHVRPAPPVRSVSCDNSAIFSNHSLSRNSGNFLAPSQARPTRDDNYVELKYSVTSSGTRTPHDPPQRELNRSNNNEIVHQWDLCAGEDLYSQPTKTPQILLNDTYVDLYPVQEKSREVPRPQGPPPPPPPPYPDFFTPVTSSSQSGSERPSALDSDRESTSRHRGETLTNIPGESLYGHHGPPRHNYGDQSYHPQQPSPLSQGSHGNFSSASGPLTNNGSSWQHGQHFTGRSSRHGVGGAITPAHAFRPIDGEEACGTDRNDVVVGGSRRNSPPEREMSHYHPSNPAITLHNSDEDSDSEFMETVI